MGVLLLQFRHTFTDHTTNHTNPHFTTTHSHIPYPNHDTKPKPHQHPPPTAPQDHTGPHHRPNRTPPHYQTPTRPHLTTTTRPHLTTTTTTPDHHHTPPPQTPHTRPPPHRTKPHTTTTTPHRTTTTHHTGPPPHYHDHTGHTTRTTTPPNRPRPHRPHHHHTTTPDHHHTVTTTTRPPPHTTPDHTTTHLTTTTQQTDHHHTTTTHHTGHHHTTTTTLPHRTHHNRTTTTRTTTTDHTDHHTTTPDHHPTSTPDTTTHHHHTTTPDHPPPHLTTTTLPHTHHNLPPPHTTTTHQPTNHTPTTPYHHTHTTTLHTAMSTKASTPNKPRRLRVSDVQEREKDEEEGLSPSPLTQHLQRQTKMAANIEKMKEAMFDFTVAKGLKPKVLKPEQHESSTGTQRGTKGEEGEERERRKTRSKMVLDTSELFLVKPSVASQTKPPGGVEEGNQDRYWFTQSHLGGLTKKDQMRMMKHFDRQVLGKQDLRDRKWISGNKAAEVYEWKLEKELRRLSDQSRPSRDRLGVFSDVFNDVCEGSPVFRDILREIKTDYDLYLNSILDSQTSLEDLGQRIWRRLGTRCPGWGRRHRGVRNQFQNARDRVMEIPDDKGLRKEATLPGLMRPGEGAVSFIDRVQPKRRQ
ncbi:unnamed protein product, partial [Coregonus sp. 'balchen']